MEKLVYAELMSSVTMEMMMDRNLLIISDNAIFIVTTPEHSVIYPHETFYDVGEEAIRDYEIEYKNGRVVSKMFSNGNVW